MPPQIFISHSSEDKEIIDFFREAFDDTRVRPATMEYEKWSRGGKPNWQWIAREVRKSTALFVILTQSVTTKVQTQNWIAFEIGIAAGRIPAIPVYVFKEEDVNFPVPYLNHYFPERLSPKPQDKLKFDVGSSLAKNNSFALLLGIIKHPKYDYEDKTFKCPTCLTVFRNWGDEEKSFNCPCCSSPIFSALHRYHKPPSAPLGPGEHRPE